jgi:hypothetical protein
VLLAAPFVIIGAMSVAGFGIAPLSLAGLLYAAPAIATWIVVAGLFYAAARRLAA